MKHDMVQYAPKGISRLPGRVADCRLNGLADGYAEAARRIRVLGQDITARLCQGGWARNAFSTPYIHHELPERLLLETDPNHKHLALKPDKGAGIGKRTSH